MKFQYSTTYPTPVAHGGINYYYDPTLVVMAATESSPAVTYAEYYNLTPQDVDAIVVTAKWDQIRVIRNGLLSETDWSQVGDIPVAIRDAYKVYRQTLRNIPQSFSNPDHVIFPTKPN